MTAPRASSASRRRHLRWWLALFPLLPLPQLLAQRLYLRIWLAVVLGVSVLMGLVGWAWRVSVEHNTTPLPHREWVVRDALGQVLAITSARPQPGQPLQIEVPLADGQRQVLFLERRGERHGPEHMVGHVPYPRELPPWWARPPYGFVGMLALLVLGAALALYPVVRRLTRRLEALQLGVQRWGDGDLSVRVPEAGDDEVADLSRRFNAAAQRIQNLLAAQKSLLANASHELRSPLARIRMALELLDGATSADVRGRTRQEILRNMAELDQLIDEILLSSRLDAREADMGTVEAVDLVGLCAEECARVGARLEVPEGLIALDVQGVSKLLRRMVRNLLENAVRYGAGLSDAQSGVLLTLAREDGLAVLRVSDHGPGVPPEFRERIFEPFFRLPGASERSGGVGLGLALVKSIAERHGGRVCCEGRDGGGVVFTVRMP